MARGRFSGRSGNSNTTNVKVKLKPEQQEAALKFDSNTTNVKVKQISNSMTCLSPTNSNTTNVKVKPTYLKALCQYYTLKSLILQVFSLFLPGGNLLLLVADTICDNSFIYKGFLSFDKISAW